MSFGRRLELLRSVREAAKTIEPDAAGKSVGERLNAAAAHVEVDRLYLEWGLQSIEGLEIDGETADVSTLIGAGPEDLCREIVAAVKRECGLSDEERKN
jgi:hypothetical protein